MKAIGRWVRRGVLAATLALGALSGTGGCTYKGEPLTGSYQLKVTVTQQSGEELPGPDGLTCLDLRGINPECPNGHFFKLQVEALDVDGKRDETFNRFVRLSILPGTIVSVTSPPEGEGVGVAEGRNVLLVNGYAEGHVVHVTGAFGPTRIVVEDIGYQPGDPVGDRKPSCADGIDNDGNGLIDFPADPGCAFSNDDTEAKATFAAGVSAPLNFVLPTLADAQGCPSKAASDLGLCAGTPFGQEGITVETRPERGANVIVTRVSTQGMYVSDIEQELDGDGNPILDEEGFPVYRAKSSGSLFVFNFGLPAGVLVCDRVTQLSGTMDEFFGYTEMTFPSFEVEPFDTRDEAITPNKECRVPEPFIIEAAAASDDGRLEPSEGGLVRVHNAHVPMHFGALPAVREVADTQNACSQGRGVRFRPGPGASNCDLDRSGSLDFSPGSEEAICSCYCYADPECSEWSAYRGRSNYRIVLGSAPDQTIQVNTAAIAGFDPVTASLAAVQASERLGKPVVAKIRSVTGTLANFSGGNLNWTIEARCAADLVLCPDNPPECVDRPDDCPERLDCADLTPCPLPSDDPAGPFTGRAECEGTTRLVPYSRKACIGQRTEADYDPGAVD